MARKSVFAIIALLLALVGAEIALRVAGVAESDLRALEMRRDLGDFVQFLEHDINVEKSVGGSLYIEDPELLWRLRPDFEGWARDFFLMTVTDKAPRWHFKINKRGFRGNDFEDKTLPGTYRVLCLGDSCVFGFGVDEGDTFPVRLTAGLEAVCPACRFEVINMGVPGYTSRQGVELAKRWIPRLKPNAVIIAYGTNDWWRRELTDDEAMERAQTTGALLNRFLRRSAIVKFLSSGVQNKPKIDRKDILSAHRVSRPEYEKNIAAISRLASEHGTKVALMDMNFYIPYGTEALRNIAKEKPGYLHVDAVEILAGSVRNLDLLREEYPVNMKIAEKIYGGEIRRRPMFYVMVDIVHPNALGHRLIADKCASLLFAAGLDRELYDLVGRTIESLPRAGATGAKALSQTELEKRISQNKDKLEQ